MIDTLKSLIKQFMPFAQEQMGFDRPPKLFLKQDKENAANPMGKTGYYDPASEAITLFVTGRHPKDIMRSLSHELMHHTQNCNGEFDKVSSMGEQGYAQNDPHMRTMEIEAYKASIVFRDWEDSCKGTIYYEHLQKGDNKMSTKDWKNGEIKSLLTESWGFKMDLSKLNEGAKPDFLDLDKDGDKKEPMKSAAKDADHDDKEEPKNEGAFDANHYCVHHGGVQHEGKIKMAEAVQHVKPDENGRITHYDMKLEDGTVLENVAVEDIQITNASLAEAHNMAKRDDHDEMKDRPEEEELEELAASSGRKSPHADRRGDDERKRPMEEAHCVGKRDEPCGKPDCPKCGGKRKDEGKRPTKKQIETLVKKALREALLKRKK